MSRGAVIEISDFVFYLPIRLRFEKLSAGMIVAQGSHIITNSLQIIGDPTLLGQTYRGRGRKRHILQ